MDKRGADGLGYRREEGGVTKLTVLDLFSGIGGFSLGLERTGGFETIQFCEIDPFCRKVLAKHWPNVPCHDDITTMEFKEGQADVITGGFPCQDISLAGRGAGLAGERSGLWRELLRAIRLVRPRYAFLENVAALLSNGMGEVTGDLAAIGYDAEWHCIPASALGAPHRRDRVWIVAYAGSQQYKGGGASERRQRAEGFHQAMANPQSERRGETRQHSQRSEEWAASGGEVLAHPERIGRKQMEQSTSRGTERKGPTGPFEYGSLTRRREWWSIEPDVGRVAHGIPQRVDRLRGLGNAVVPQIPELIGNAILEAERG